MADKVLDQAALPLGKEYVAALKDLRFDIEYAAWAFDEITDGFVLVIVSDFIDLVGPLEISKHLFSAYRACATPASLCPFQVRIHSPRQEWYRSTADMLAGRFLVGEFKPDHPERWNIPEEHLGLAMQIQKDGMLFHPDWTIQAPKSKRKTKLPVQQRWRRFNDSITALAA